MNKKPSTLAITEVKKVKDTYIDITCPVCKRKFRLKAGRVIFCPWGCIVAGFEITPLPGE